MSHQVETFTFRRCYELSANNLSAVTHKAEREEYKYAGRMRTALDGVRSLLQLHNQELRAEREKAKASCLQAQEFAWIKSQQLADARQYIEDGGKDMEVLLRILK